MRDPEEKISDKERRVAFIIEKEALSLSDEEMTLH